MVASSSDCLKAGNCLKWGKAMVLISDGTSEMGAHVLSEILDLIS